MSIVRSSIAAAFAALLFVLALAPAAVYAGQRDIDLLGSYVGDWRGRGTLTTAADPETVVCKLSITPAETAKVNYNGRCTLAGGSLAIAGTMAYIGDKNRFEAVMSSNTTFTGIAVGHRRGGAIDFTLREKDPDTGADLKIEVGFDLRDGVIQVDFSITQVSTGKTSKAEIPFKKA